MSKNKSIILLLVLLGLSSITNAVYNRKTPQASLVQTTQEEEEEEIFLQACQITYQTVTLPPVCETEPEGNQAEQPVCMYVPPDVEFAIIDPFRNTLSKPEFELDEVDYVYEENGPCQSCVLQVWNQPYFEGNTETFSFVNNQNPQIRVQDIWNQETKSFKITCDL